LSCIDLCEELDKQVMGYEAINERLEEKMAKMEADNRNLGKLLPLSTVLFSRT
jgi:hypothetical protein